MLALRTSNLRTSNLLYFRDINTLLSLLFTSSFSSARQFKHHIEFLLKGRDSRKQMMIFKKITTFFNLIKLKRHVSMFIIETTAQCVRMQIRVGLHLSPKSTAVSFKAYNFFLTTFFHLDLGDEI